jgi:hypothetical protein
MMLDPGLRLHQSLKALSLLLVVSVIAKAMT